MINFPNCKINIGLNIVGKREDGYHNLETVFYPLPWHDALEIIQSEKFQFFSTGNSIPIAAEENICTKAYQLLKKDFDLPTVHMHLHKVIPTGAGLGGGSADGAFTLLLLNKKFKLELSEAQLIDYALQLGSDCPIFILNQPCFASSRGEKLIPVELDLSTYKIVLVHPGMHISTAWAFNNLKLKSKEVSIKEVVSKPVHEWNEFIFNDFEEPVFEHYAEIGEVKKLLISQGALYASLTGSGSAVYGIFDKEAETDFKFPEHYQYKVFNELKPAKH
jgi:4-diphosphocytidyl-2-C-methyl-D-erythritol kinase